MNRGALALTLFTPPDDEPVSLAEAKLHLRETGIDQDGRIVSLIKAARQYVEVYLWRTLIETEFDWYLDCFPAEFLVPRPPLISVTSIKYVDTAGVEQTLSASLYRVDTASEPARIAPAYGEVWPSIREINNAVVVRFKAGYGDGPGDVPESIRQAMLLLIGTMYERRETDIVGAAATVIPFGAVALLAPYRAIGF